ncbi:MAG TPA: MFS transporter, partial [Ktedonobacterales bacterium]
MHPTTTSNSPAPATPKKPGLLINRNFALLWSGQTISIIGDFAFSTTLAVWVFTLSLGQPWAPLAVTGVYIATALPMILIGPLAGVFVDRWNKRRTMLVMDVLSAILVAALLPLTGIVPLGALAQLPGVGDTLGSILSSILVGGQPSFEWRLGTIYAVVFLVSGVGQFFAPSKTALIGDLVPDPLRGRAIGLSQASQSIALLLGTLIAPPLFVAFGAQWTLTFDALSFIVSYLAIRAISAPAAASSLRAGERGHVGRELVAGIRFSLRSRVLRTILIAAIIVMAGAGVTNSLDVF